MKSDRTEDFLKAFAIGREKGCLGDLRWQMWKSLDMKLEGINTDDFRVQQCISELNGIELATYLIHLVGGPADGLMLKVHDVPGPILKGSLAMGVVGEDRSLPKFEDSQQISLSDYRFREQIGEREAIYYYNF